jgi:hypothetical protein
LTKWIACLAPEFGVSIIRRGGEKGDRLLNNLRGGVELAPRKRGWQEGLWLNVRFRDYLFSRDQVILK